MINGSSWKVKRRKVWHSLCSASLITSFIGKGFTAEVQGALQVLKKILTYLEPMIKKKWKYDRIGMCQLPMLSLTYRRYFTTDIDCWKQTSDTIAGF
jgi:hypothetical protein